ncbi:MAG: CoA transferase [Alphaproteobacteria bacterium]|nr:CoA transferase [Alphaproteobacteria bacterium]MBM3613483.1 CoA transferase [Alphaproteobacteria bacterium]
MPAPQASAALRRFTVLDLTRVRSGPTAVRQLADWGANVVKIELPAHLEEGETMGGPRDGADFMNLHRNKRSMTLDLKSEAGLALFRRMAARADVVVENFRPDVKQRLGISYQDLRAINPRIVYASISGFGQDGPYARRPGFDQIAQGMGGLMSVTGLPGQGPVRAGIPLADLTSGLFCALGVLTALLEREQSGEGQWVRTSLLQAQAFMLDFQAARYLVHGEVAQQAGNNHPTSIPTGVFRTSDGYLNIATSGQAIWERCARAIGAEALVAHPDYATGALRSRNRDALNAALQEVFLAEATATWVERLNAAGVPCGPIHDIAQMFADPQVRHLGVAARVDGTTTDLMAQPVALSRTPSRLAAPSPARGEHGDEILAEFGLSPDEVAALRTAGTI